MGQSVYVEGKKGEKERKEEIRIRSKKRKRRRKIKLWRILFSGISLRVIWQNVVKVLEATSIDFYQTTRCHIEENSTHHGHCHENIKFQAFFIFLPISTRAFFRIVSLHNSFLLMARCNMGNEFITLKVHYIKAPDTDDLNLQVRFSISEISFLQFCEPYHGWMTKFYLNGSKQKDTEHLIKPIRRILWILFHSKLLKMTLTLKKQKISPKHQITILIWNSKVCNEYDLPWKSYN